MRSAVCGSEWFYNWLRLEPSQYQKANEALVLRIRGIHERSRQTYVYPRIHAELREAGEKPGCQFNQPYGIENGLSPPLLGHNPVN